MHRKQCWEAEVPSLDGTATVPYPHRPGSSLRATVARPHPQMFTHRSPLLAACSLFPVGRARGCLAKSILGHRLAVSTTNSNALRRAIFGRDTTGAPDVDLHQPAGGLMS